jgi:hypothetical protein
MRKHAIFGIAAVMLALAIWASLLGSGADAARSNGFYVSAADSFLPVRHLERFSQRAGQTPGGHGDRAGDEGGVGCQTPDSAATRLAGISERGHHLGRSKVSRKDATQA